MNKNVSKTSKNLSGKYSQKRLDHANKWATNQFANRSKRETAEAIGDSTGNKVADKLAKSYDGRATKVSKASQQNTSEAVTNKHDKEMSKERYISPEERLNLLTIWDFYNSIIMKYQKIINLLDNTRNQPTKFRTKS